MNRKSFLIVWLLLFSAMSAQAQEKKVYGLNADELKARQVDGRTVVDLIRPVLTQEKSVLSSEFGMDEGNGFVQFWGHVLVIEEGDTLRANRIRYNRNTKIGVAEGDVFLTDGLADIHAPVATHYSDEERTEFEDGVAYADSSGTLSARRAVYYTDINKAVFFNDVTFQQDEITVQADSIEYAREDDISEAWGRVYVDQQTDSTHALLLSEYLYRNAVSDSIAVWGGSRLVSIDTQDSDTLFVSAERMFLVERDSLDTVTAIDSVVVSSPNYALMGDSLRTSTWKDGKRSSKMFGSPMAWLKENQIHADSLFFTSGAAASDSLQGFGSVFVASRDSLSGRIQQLKGQKLVAVLIQDALRSLLVEGNAEALFYTRENPEDPVTGVKASGDGVLFRFEDEELSQVSFYEGIKGMYYAENLLDQLTNLSGYRWNPELMPDRAVLSSQFWTELQSRRRSEEH